jgi:microcystin-dependent protein
MATVTASYNWVSGETVTPAKLNTTAAPTVVVADNEITTAKILDGNVTLAKLVTAVQQALLPAGAVQAFAMNSAPAGWLAADGSNVNRTTYASLFSAISTTYGAGDGSTTFALPDLRGYFVRGSGTNSDSTAAGTFGTKQADELKAHTHSVTDPGHTHGTDPYATNQAGSQIGYTSPLTSRFGDDTGSSTTGISIQSTGGTETRPKNIALLYCIKF